jgi:hypothetical protein
MICNAKKSIDAMDQKQTLSKKETRSDIEQPLLKEGLKFLLAGFLQY